MDVAALQVLDRMLHADEERKAKTGSDDEEEEEEGKLSTMPHPISSSSSPAGEVRRERAEVNGCTAQLDPARLKPGHKREHDKQV